MSSVCGITDIRNGGSNPFQEEGEDYREWSLTSEHGSVDTCHFGDLYTNIQISKQ